MSLTLHKTNRSFRRSVFGAEVVAHVVGDAQFAVFVVGEEGSGGVGGRLVAGDPGEVFAAVVFDFVLVGPVVFLEEDCGARVGGLAAFLVLPCLYIGALTSHKCGKWFVNNWGAPYVEAIDDQR